MEWLIENIGSIIGGIGLACVVGIGIYKFVKLGKEKQIEKIKEWLLFACIQAEKELGGGTGQLKLRYVYDLFVKNFDWLKLIISFEQFSGMVDEALDKMRKMLNTNEKVKEIVEGNK